MVTTTRHRESDDESDCIAGRAGQRRASWSSASSSRAPSREEKTTPVRKKHKKTTLSTTTPKKKKKTTKKNGKFVAGRESEAIEDGAFAVFAEYLPSVDSASNILATATCEEEEKREEDDNFRFVVVEKTPEKDRDHHAPPSLCEATGPAQEAIDNSNKVPASYKPRRTPWIVRAVGKHKKYIKNPKRRHEPPVGKVIGGEDEQYVLTYAMRLGIKRGVEYASKALPDSFEAATSEKLVTNFPPEGSAATPKHKLKHNFNVTDFAPCVFSKIRHLMGVTDDVYLKSVCDAQLGFIEFIANSRSGQYFFYTSDHVFMIKTLRADEKKFLLKLLPDYYAHLVAHSNDRGLAMVGSERWASAESAKEAATTDRTQRRHFGLKRQASTSKKATTGLHDSSDDEDDHGAERRTQRERPDVVYGQEVYAHQDNGGDSNVSFLQEASDASLPNNNESLLNRFYGLHCIRLRHLKRKVYFVVMASIYGGVKWQNLSYQYDLKGSSFKRKAKDTDFVLKDNDARDVGLKIGVGSARCRALLRACASDAEFLARNGVMDYSLLVGILHVQLPDGYDLPSQDESSEEPLRASRQLSAGSLDGDNTVACYFLGIIDILQVYNARKHIETDINIVSKGLKRSHGCSCVPPDEYRDRFIDFLKTIIVE